MSRERLVEVGTFSLPEWFYDALRSGEVPDGKGEDFTLFRQGLTLRAGTEEWELAYDRDRYRLLARLPVSEKLWAILNMVAGSGLFDCRLVKRDTVVIQAKPVFHPNLISELEIGDGYTWAMIGETIASTARQETLLDARNYLTGLK